MDYSIAVPSKLGASAVASGAHTPEPWHVTEERPYRIMAAALTPQRIEAVVANLTSLDLPNARRIVACVNACKGIPTEDLGRWGINLIDKIREDEAHALAKLDTPKC